MNKPAFRLRDYFEDKLKEHGPTARGVDWNSERRQEICFQQLVRIMENPHGIAGTTAPQLLDYGCGYGALACWLVQAGLPFSRYQGFDFTPAMIEQARNLLALWKMFNSDRESSAPGGFCDSQWASRTQIGFRARGVGILCLLVGETVMGL